MPGKFLIDITDPRFLVAPNEDVIEFIRRANPFAHSDVGSLLLDLGKSTPGALAYCPAFRSFAYVVLHTSADRIFAIAYGQREIAFRLPDADREGAFADGGVPAPPIGRDWIAFDPWSRGANSTARARLGRWCTRALAFATGAASAEPPLLDP